MREKVIKLYQFDELSEQAQEKALEKLWDLNVFDSYWFESTTEDIKEFGKTSGLHCEYGGEFDIDRASYVSIIDCNTTVTDLVENAEKVKHEFPNVYKEVIEPFVTSFTAKELRQIARLERTDYLGSIYGETSSHRKGRQANVERYDTRQKRVFVQGKAFDYTYTSSTPRITRLIDKVESAWEDLLRDLEHTYLTMLRREYEFQTSEEQVKESILANEYEFLEDGTIA